MAESANSKLKLLHLIDILTEYTDDEHPMSAEEICQELARRGMEVHRKTIYRDIKSLMDYGYDILKLRVPKAGYALGQRRLELPEIRLMIDAVQAATFITPGKTRELIVKLESFLSKSQAEAFSRQVYMDYGTKQKNEEIYYSIDFIGTAISKGKKVKLNYFRRQLAEDFTASFSSREFIVSPYAMLWSNDHYYLVCNTEKYDNLMHLRLDRVRSVEILEEPVRPIYEVSEYSDTLDIADYSSKIFNMFGGEEDKIELRCKNSMLESIIDRFGAEVPLRRSGEGYFVVSTRAIVSEGLDAWLLQFGTAVEVLSPRYLRERIMQKSAELYALYHGKK